MMMMQTSKQHSPESKKGTASSIKSDNSNKSIAQRVMEVASNSSNGTCSSSISHHNMNKLGVGTNFNKKNKTNSSSVEGDQEVEEITNRAANLDISPESQQLQQVAVATPPVLSTTTTTTMSPITTTPTTPTTTTTPITITTTPTATATITTTAIASTSAPVTTASTSNSTPTNIHNYNHKYNSNNCLATTLKNPLESCGTPSLLLTENPLLVLSLGLAQDPTNERLFEALIDAALQSPFRNGFEAKYNILKTLEQDRKPFVVVSVLGQELLAQRYEEHAAIILESALTIGIDNRKLIGSVLSTISYAYCIMKEYERAITYMQKELVVESELEDVEGQCRVLSNLGYTYYKMQKYENSLEAHRGQINLAMRNQLFQKASIGLNAIGHVHVARQDYNSALTSHSWCLDLLKQLGDNDFNQFKELLSIGYMHVMLGDYDAADKRYREGSSLLKQSDKLSPEEYTTGQMMVNYNLAYLALKKQSFDEAKLHYSKALELSQKT